MKKVLAIILAVILVASTAVVAYARGGFVSSPSGKPAPVIITIEFEDGSCKPEIVITPYSEIDELIEKKKQDMKAAYDEIAANTDLTKICAELRAVAEALKVKIENLAISDLFDLSAYHKIPHDYCGSIKITLSAETIKNFVALIHRKADGTWENIQDVVVNEAENSITFSARDFSPFAVVVDTSSDIPDTGDFLIIPAATMVISAVSLAGILISLKKKKQEA